MRKNYSLIFTTLLTALFLLPWSGKAWAYDPLTVAHGTATNNMGPVYGSRADSYVRTQTIYMAELLTTMSGKQITAITFYVNTAAAEAWTSTFEVRLAEVTASTFSSKAWNTESTGTLVYTGSLDATGSTMTITFDNPFVYNGGNLLLDIKNQSGGNWKNAKFYGITSYGGESIYQVVSGYSSSSSSFNPNENRQKFLPKATFTYEDAPSGGCTTPTGLTKSSVSATSASFSWTAGGDETSWQYICLPAGTAVDWSDAAVKTASTTPAANVSGLSPNTSYKFYVRAYCDGGEGEQSSEVSVAFTTPCAGVASLSTGFESDANGSLPDCWNRISSNSYPQVYEYSDYAKSGSKSLYFYQAGPQYAILPPFSQDVKNLEISFWYRNYSYSELLQVGYMTDPEDATTFVSLQTLPYITSYNAEATVVSLSSAAVGAKYIAFKYTCSSSWGKSFIDDIVVETASSCAKPTGLSASAASATSGTISWTENGSATAWNVQFSTDESTWTTRAATTNPYTLTVPSANTTYYVQVQSNCGGETSGWTTSQTFTTPCVAQTGIGFTEDFEGVQAGYDANYNTYHNMPDCWMAISGDESVYVRSSGGKTGQCLYMYGSSSANQTAVLPLFTEDLNTLTISFYYKNYTTSTSYGQLKVGYYSNNTFTSLAPLTRRDSYDSAPYELVISGAPSGARIAFKIDNGTYKNEAYIDNIVITKTPTCFKPASVTVNSSTYNGVNFSWTESGHGETQWQYAVVAAGATPSSWSDATSTKSASVSGLTTGSSYEVCVRSYCGPSDQSELTRSASFIPTCQAPSGVTVSAITNNSASVNWTANNGESTWNLQYRKGTGSWTTKSNITKPYALTGLDANSTYEVKVACAEGCTSGYSTAASFKTKCDAIAEAELPYENNFESATTYKLPSCWDKIGSGDYPQVLSGSAAYGGSGKCLGFYGNSMQTAILPGFETAINKLMITFHYRHSYSDVQIGYVKANGDFVPKETLPTRSAYNEVSPYEVEMSDWGDEAVYIAFCMANTTSSYANAYIDNVKVEKAPTCFKPAGWDNANTTIGANSATIAWTAPAKNESQYQYICVPSGETPDWDSEDAHLTSSRNATIDNLQPASAYDFYVRSYCAADDQSEIISKSFSTTCGTFTLTDDSPFEYDFEGGTWGQTPTCWTTHYASGYHAYFSNGSAHTGSKALDVLASKNTGSETFVVLPKLSMALNKLAISFYYKGTAGATIQVGYMTDKDNKGTFTAVGDALIASASYKLGAVPLASVSADAYIAIRFKGNTGDGDFYIDDVRVARTELFTDGEDNFQTRLTGLADQTLDVLMTRPLQFDGYYSTLCLPFDLSAEQLADADCPLYNFTIKYFDYVEVQNEELIISIAPTGTITAGVPYFVMANAASYDKPLLFRDVTISAATPAYKVSEGVKYQGVFNNVGLAAQTENDTHDIIYLGRGNQLYWPDAAVTVKGFRAYFNADTSGPNNSPIHRGMKLSFGEGHGTTTAIERIGTDADGVRKVLENGRIIIIRDGKRYSVMGQVIE